MKIKKGATLVKPKHNQLDKALQPIEAALRTCKDEELLATLRSIDRSAFRKGDLYYWIDVLNRFDDVLENSIKKSMVLSLTPEPEDAENTLVQDTPNPELIVEILSFTEILLDKFKNKQLYSSIEHVCYLLNSESTEVVHAATHLLYNMATSSRSSLGGHIIALSKKLLVFAYGHTSLSIKDAVTLRDLPDKVISDGASLRYEFYRDTYERDQEKATNAAASLADGHKKKAKKDHASLAKKTGDQKKDETGVTVINISNVSQESASNGEGVFGLFRKLVAENNIPERYQFSLWTRMRLANDIRPLEKRILWAKIRLYSLTIMARANQNSEEMTMFFHHNPEFIPELAAILRAKDVVPREVIEAVLRVLFACCSNRSRAQEIVRVLLPEDNTYDALLPMLVRDAVSTLTSPSMETMPYDYDTLLDLVNVMSTTNIGSQSLQDSGLLTESLAILNVRKKGTEKILAKYLVILETLMQAHHPSIPQVLEAGALTRIISLLNDEVTEIHGEVEKMRAKDKSTDSTTKDVIPSERLQLLHSIFRALSAIINTNSTLIRPREILETSFSTTLLNILELPQYYGGFAFSLAGSTLSSLINNDPTCFPLVEQKGLVTVIINTMKNLPPNADVISIIAPIITAFCLSEAGQQIVRDADPYGSLLKVLIDPKYEKVVAQGDIATLMGTDFNELMRHVPATREAGIDAAVALLTELQERSERDQPDIEMTSATTDTANATSSTAQPKEPSKEKLENQKRLAIAVSNVSKMLSTLLQNAPEPSRLFVEKGGLRTLLKICERTSDAQSVWPALSYLNGHQPAQVFKAVLEAVSNQVNALAQDGSPSAIKEHAEVNEDQLHKLAFIANMLNFMIKLQYTSSVTEWSRANGNDLLEPLAKLNSTVLWKLCCKLTEQRQKEQQQQQQQQATEEGEQPKKKYKSERNVASSSSSSPAEPLTPSKVHKKKTIDTAAIKVSTVLRAFSASVSYLQETLETAVKASFSQAASQPARTLATALAKCIIGPLTYFHELSGDLEPKCCYLEMAVNAASRVIFDERRKNVDTLVLSEFKKEGGVDRILQAFEEVSQLVLDLKAQGRLGTDKEKSASSTPTKELKDKKAEEDKPVHDDPHEKALASCVRFMSRIVSPQHVVTSPMTTNMVISSDSAEGFDPATFVAELQKMVARSAIKVWQHQSFPQLCEPFMVHFITTIAHILKGVEDKETKGIANRLTGAAAKRPAPALVPDATAVTQLMEMGFPRNRAEEALRATQNNVVLAMEWIWSNPEPEAPPPQQQQESEVLSEEDELARAIAMSLGEGGADEQKKEEEGAAPEDVQIPEVNPIQIIREGVLSWSINLLHKPKDYSLACSDLLNLLCKDKSQHAVVIDTLTKSIKTLATDSNAGEEPLSSLLHCAGLLLQNNAQLRDDISKQESFVDLLLHIVRTRLETLSSAKKSENTNNVQARIISACLLAFDALCQPVPLEQPDAERHTDKKTSSSSTSSEGASKAPATLETLKERAHAYMSQYDAHRLMDVCVQMLLNSSKLNSDIVQGLLKVIAKITVSQEDAKKILDNGCLQALLGMPVELRCANHAVLAETILRHAIEDQSTLQSAMETELKKSVPKLIRQNGRLNVSSFVRSFASMFRRDPDAFFKAVQATCSIKAGSPSVSLKENLLPSQPAPESLEAMRRVLYALLDFLVAPPVAVKDSVKAKDKGKGKLTAVHDQADNNESNAERRKLALSKHHLVQFVADFVASYNGCADHVLSYTNPAMKTNIVRWVLLNVVQYACSPSQREQDELFRKKMQENKMGTYLISALFSHQPQRVLAEITSLLKDSKSLPHPLRAIHSTSDLLFLFISNKLQKNAAASEDLAKMLVRAGIVDALTRCLAVIDLNHPDAVEVTNSVLKVLEHLTRVSRGEMPVDEEKGKPKPVERAAISAMETEEAKPATENEIEMDFTYFTTSNNGNEDYYARESDEEEEEEEEEDEDEEEGQQEEEEEEEEPEEEEPEEEEPEEEEEDNVDEGDGGEHPALMSDSDSEMSEEVMSDANSIRAQLQMLDGSGEDLAVQFGELEDALEIRLNIGGIASTLIRGSRSGNYAELFDGLFNLARGRAATLRPAATSNIEYQPISFSSGSTVPPPQPLARDRSLFSSAGLFGSGWNEVVPMRPARMYGSNRWSEDGLESSLSSSSALLSNIEAVITQLIQEKKPVEKEEKKDEKKESKKESSGLFGEDEDEDEDDDNDEDDKDEHREDHEERAAIPAAVESTSTTAAQSSPMEVDQSTVNTSSSTLDTTSASSAPTEETNAAPQPPAAIPPEQQPTTTTSATVAAASEADSSPMELDQSSSSVQQLSAQTSDQTAQQQEARPDEQQAAQGSVQEAQEASTTATTSPSTTDAQAQPQQSTEQQVEQSAPSNVDAAQGAAASSSSSSSSAPDFGLDPTFLAALPEDLRREVLSTHIAQLMSTHRASGGSATDSIIDPQFLAALPADIQAEVLEQERLIREANRPADSNNAQDMDIASFIATLSPDLREEVLLTSDDSVLSTLPPELAAEAHALRERYNRRYARPQFARRGGGAIGANPSRRDSASQQPAPGTQPLKSQDEENKGEPVVSDEALVSLVKLLYICQPISKVLLQKTLLNLCAHSHSRATLVKLFMGMLEFHDSTERVPEEFAPVVSSRLLGIPSHAALPSSNDPGNSIPKMVLRRALDILIFLAKNNNRVLALLVSGFKKKKKKDEKEETPSTKKDEKRVAAQQPEQLPVSKLFGLVSDPQFVHSNELLENLLQLLDITVDFLNKLIREAARRKEAKRKRAEEKKKAEKEKAEAEEKKKKEEEERAAATASSTTTTTTTTSAAAPTTEVRDEVMVDTEKKPEHKEESEEEEEDELNIPVSIFSAEANLRHLVQVLVRDECSEQAVQRAESVMNNVCLAAPKSRSVVLKELSGLIMEEARQVARLFDMSPTVSGNKSSSSSAATTGQDPLSAHESKFRRIIKTYAAIYAPEKHKKAAPTRRIADDESDSSQSEEENDDLFVARTRSPIVSSVEGAKDNSASAQPEAADEKRFNYFREDSLDFLWDKMQAFISQQTINNAEAAAAAATTMTVAPLAPPPTVPSPIASPSAVIGARAAAATNSSGPAADSVFSAKILPLVEAFFIFQSMFIKDNEEEKRQQEAGGRRKPGEKPKVALAPMLPPSPTIAKAMEQVEGASGPIDFNALLNAPNANASQQQKPAISRLEQFMADNRKALNSLVRANPNLLKGSLSLMMKFPKHVDFDNKRTWFRQKLKSRQDPYGGARITVRRKHIFVDSYYHLRMRTPEELKGHLSVRFEGEEGVDAGGLTREWFLELSREMFNPNYALFVPSADGSTYQPSPLSYMNGDHISYFKFVGRVIGMAIYNEQLLDAYFTRSFYKHILGIPISYHDIESIDPEYYRTLRWMLENDVTHMDFVFAVDHEEFGKRSEVELKEGGANIAVTNANKGEYVRLITELKMTKSIQAQISAFLEGFHELVPPELIRVFDERELELLISGLPDIDIADLKANTVYHNQYSPSHPVIQWFWRAVDSLDREERAHLVQFVTGTSKVPLDGFASLQGMHGVQKFNIHRVPGGANANNRLPTAHTCFNQLDLPEYTSYEVLRKNLLLAIREGHEGFGFV